MTSMIKFKVGEPVQSVLHKCSAKIEHVIPESKTMPERYLALHDSDTFAEIAGANGFISIVTADLSGKKVNFQIDGKDYSAVIE